MFSYIKFIEGYRKIIIHFFLSYLSFGLLAKDIFKPTLSDLSK